MNGRTAALLVILAFAGGAYVLRELPRDADDQTGVPPKTTRTQLADSTRETPAYSRVDDEAQILNPFGARLDSMAQMFERDLGIDVRIVTRNDATARIEAQANALFEGLKIGATAPTGGLLVLVNPELGQARIEVGYSLEGSFTDTHMGRLARHQLAPYASYGAAGMAVMDVLHYLRDHAYAAAALGGLELPAHASTAPTYLEYAKFLSGGAGARAALGDRGVDADFKQRIPDALRARYAPSANPEEALAAYLRAMREFAGDPTLELFTEGSQLMRSRYPFAPFEELKRLSRIEASQPLQFRVQDDRAVVVSARPAHGFVPVLLHRIDGLWRIDLVETWKNFFFDADGNYYLRNARMPYAFGLSEFGRSEQHDVWALPLYKGQIAATLQAFEQREGALAALWRGDIWLRNAFVFPDALHAFEEARRLAPHDPLVLQIIGDRALYVHLPEMAVPAFEALGRGSELSLARAYAELGDTAKARQSVERAIEENPYDLHAWRWLQHLAKRDGREADQKKAEQTIATLLDDPHERYKPVTLYFEPGWPRFEPSEPRIVDGVKVFDHSEFSVTIRNTSKRTVRLDSVALTSAGTARASGLGDIRNYWTYPAGDYRLRPGEARQFQKTWGFTVDTGHEHVRYMFRTCWRGDDDQRQCRTQWVDALPVNE